MLPKLLRDPWVDTVQQQREIASYRAFANNSSKAALNKYTKRLAPTWKQSLIDDRSSYERDTALLAAAGDAVLAAGVEIVPPAALSTLDHVYKAKLLKWANHDKQFHPLSRKMKPGMKEGIEENPGPKPNSSLPKKQAAKAMRKVRRIAAANAIGVAKWRRRAMKRENDLVDNDNRQRTMAKMMPTQMQTIEDVRPGYKTLKSPLNMKKIQATFSLGQLNMANLNTVNSQYNPGQSVASITVDRNIFQSTQVANDFASFERWRVKSAVVTFVASTGSTTSGLLQLWSDPDPDDNIYQYQALTSNQVASHRDVVEFTIWNSKKVRANLQKALLWTDAQLTNLQRSAITAAQTVNQASDPRLTSAGIINVNNGTGVSSSTTTIGELWLKVVLEFSVPQFSDLANLLFNVRAFNNGSALSTGQLVNGSVVDPFTLVAFQTLSGVNTVVEGCYNPRYFNGPATGSGITVWNLLPGEYLYEFCFCYASSNVTAIAPYLAVPTNDAVYGYGSGAGVQTSVTIKPDFASVTYTSFTSNLISGFIHIRVLPANSSNNGTSLYTQVAFASTVTSTASSNLTYIAGSLRRIPSFELNGMACSFPSCAITYIEETALDKAKKIAMQDKDGSLLEVLKEVELRRGKNKWVKALLEEKKDESDGEIISPGV